MRPIWKNTATGDRTSSNCRSPVRLRTRIGSTSSWRNSSGRRWTWTRCWRSDAPSLTLPGRFQERYPGKVKATQRRLEQVAVGHGHVQPHLQITGARNQGVRAIGNVRREPRNVLTRINDGDLSGGADRVDVQGRGPDPIDLQPHGTGHLRAGERRHPREGRLVSSAVAGGDEHGDEQQTRPS